MTKAVACMLALVLALSLMPTTSLNAFNAFAQDEADTVAVDQTTTGAGATEEASAADTATAPSATEEPAPAVEGDTAGADSPDVTASDPDVSTDGSAADAGVPMLPPMIPTKIRPTRTIPKIIQPRT